MTQADYNSHSIPVVDTVDQEIISLLRIDGRMTFAEIAKRLGIPEGTARYRVQRLLQSGIIQISAWPNLEKLGTPHVLILLLTLEIGRVEAVAAELAGMEETRFVAIATGRYNVVADVCYGTHADLLAFFNKLHQIQGIRSYESQTTLKLLKAGFKESVKVEFVAHQELSAQERI